MRINNNHNDFKILRVQDYILAEDGDKAICCVVIKYAGL